MIHAKLYIKLLWGSGNEVLPKRRNINKSLSAMIVFEPVCVNLAI